MIITIANLKGGVGKTTAAIALASVADADGKKAKVLDCDPQASASLWADMAEDGGDPLPFDVIPANVSSVRRLKAKGDKWAIIDCPPTGSVTDEAVKVADIVVVPTGTGTADIQKTIETTSTLEESGKAYAVLICRAVANTLTLKSALVSLQEENIKCFKHIVPQREDLKTYFGNAFKNSFYEYDGVYKEIKKKMGEK